MSKIAASNCWFPQRAGSLSSPFRAGQPVAVVGVFALPRHSAQRDRAVILAARAERLALACGAAAGLALGRRMRRRRSRRARTVAGVAHVFEFFSGIGGMRTAFQLATSGSGQPLPKWRALEVDETCLDAYAHVFGSPVVRGIRAEERWRHGTGEDEAWRCSIDKLPDEALEGADLWLLSPPCQPFIRTGKKMDVKDSRNAALLRLLDALPSLAAPPRALLLENVPEFVGSQMHGRLQQALQQCSFTEVEELVLDPRDFGFPNTRRRFYCLALQGSCSSKIGPSERLPGSEAPAVPVRPVRDFCLPHVATAAERGDLSVPRKLLQRATEAAWQFDVATASSLATKTFTASYGKPGYAEEGLSKAGPLLLMDGKGSLASADEAKLMTVAQLRAKLGELGLPQNGTKRILLTRLLDSTGLAPAEEQRKRFGHIAEADWHRVRYFAPEEILALQGFPETWRLPQALAVRTQWRLVGNSINVTVVSKLIGRLLARL